MSKVGWMKKSLSRIPRGGGASYVVLVLIVLSIAIYAVLSRTTFLGLQPGAFSPDQSCLTDEIHASTVRDVLYLRLHYFISPSQASFRAYGINSVQDHVLMIPTMGVPLLIQASSKVERDPHDHWSSDFQAMLPPSCHFWFNSPLHVSKNGLSCPGLDARHFPDTLKRKSSITWPCG